MVPLESLKDCEHRDEAFLRSLLDPDSRAWKAAKADSLQDGLDHQSTACIDRHRARRGSVSLMFRGQRLVDGYLSDTLQRLYTPDCSIEFGLPPIVKLGCSRDRTKTGT
jgi:hypothetical protein